MGDIACDSNRFRNWMFADLSESESDNCATPPPKSSLKGMTRAEIQARSTEKVREKLELAKQKEMKWKEREKVKKQKLKEAEAKQKEKEKEQRQKKKALERIAREGKKAEEKLRCM